MKIIINPEFPKQNNSNFTKYVKNNEINNLEKKLISNDCVNEKSFYDTLDTVIINGIYYKLLKKGNFIFRTFPGFNNDDNTENMTNDEYIWYSNKYVSYSFCR